MTKKIVNKLTLSNCILQRKFNINKALITWEVISKDKTTRVGMIRQFTDYYDMKRVGWQEFPQKYWLGTRFYPRFRVIADTRREIINLLLNYERIPQ